MNAARDAVQAAAVELGFDAVGFASAADPWPAGARLMEFIAHRRHGQMEWMETTLDRRAHPTAMWADARTAVMVGVNYGPERDPMEALERRSEGIISVYARGGDYHDLIKKRLKRLAGRVAEITGGDVKVFVDTAPLMEKPLAERAGIGWQGKHTNLVSRDLGSWLFLGAVLTSADLPPDEPETDHCGACRRCLDVCPTDAFPNAYELDARRCLSYLTIEHAGPIPREFRAAMGNRIYGCDDCLAVCPWNKFAAVAREHALQPRPELTAPALADLVELDDAGFRQVFAGTAVKRVGRDRFVRNVLIAIGNSADPRLLSAAEARLDDPQPLIRGAAVWAVWRLASEDRFRACYDERGAGESDPDVADEWNAGLKAWRRGEAA